MNDLSSSQVTLLPAQLGRLAELFPDGSPVNISVKYSVIVATNGHTIVMLNAEGHPIENPDQETFPLC